MFFIVRPVVAFGKPLPTDCVSCLYKHMPADGGHCYMFKEKTEGNCAQYKGIAGATNPST